MSKDKPGDAPDASAGNGSGGVDREQALADFLQARGGDTDSSLIQNPLGFGTSEDATSDDADAGDTAAGDRPDAGPDDGDGPGKGAGGTAKAGDLPKGVKDRIARAQRKARLLRDEKAALQAENAKLKAQLNGTQKPETQATSQSSPSEDTSDDDEPDFPMEEEYSTHADYEADVALWLDRKFSDMRGGDKKVAPDADKARKAAQTQEDPQAELGRVLDDIRDAVEAAAEDDDEDDLMDEFLELGSRSRLAVSRDMLDQMAEMEDADARRVVEHFVNRPASANKINRLSTRRQRKALDDLVKRLRKGASEKPTADKDAGFDGADTLRGNVPDSGTIANAEDYLAFRQRTDSKRPRDFGLSF